MATSQVKKTEAAFPRIPITGATKDGEWKVDFDWLQKVQNEIGLDEDLGFVSLETIEGTLLAAIKVSGSHPLLNGCLLAHSLLGQLGIDPDVRPVVYSVMMGLQGVIEDAGGKLLGVRVEELLKADPVTINKMLAEIH